MFLMTSALSLPYLNYRTSQIYSSFPRRMLFLCYASLIQLLFKLPKTSCS